MTQSLIHFSSDFIEKFRAFIYPIRIRATLEASWGLFYSYHP